jgi:carbamoyltransferase
MIILGLHFGHDAAVTVIDDGRILSYVLKERHARVKHALGLDADLVGRALDEAGVSVDRIDLCAVCSTQGVELVGGAPALRVELGTRPGPAVPCTLEDELRASGASIESRQVSTVLDSLYAPERRVGWLPDVWAALFPEHRSRPRAEFPATGCIDTFITEPAWEAGAALAEIGARAVELSEARRFGFHYPAVVRLGGRAIPAHFVHHHLAHAASSYYLSEFDEAAIFTHDGYADGVGYHSGMCYFGRGHRIYPLLPHHLAVGALYDRVGVMLKLSTLGPAGKLMGLAAYGQPRFFDPRFVGNHFDHRARFKNDLVSAWMYHCISTARRAGYDMDPYGDPARATAPINTDIAASTQKLFEEIRGDAVGALRALLERSGLPARNLCLSGGTALNCPSNSRIAAESGFERVWVEPACDDGGLAIGAALVLYHSLLDQPRGASPPWTGPSLGVRHSEEDVRRALAEAGDKVVFQRRDEPGRAAGQELADNRVIGWFEGRSEAGPRALGNRSILADPRRAENWPKVNRIKGREPWRPFAPAVLVEEASRWFDGAPLPSPHMLFNARVKSDRIPAITHVDGTARIQTVDASNGEYRRLIERFFELTGVPVILNTSFNGPGEPLVETPSDALSFFLESELDALYLDDYRVERRGQETP